MKQFGQNGRYNRGFPHGLMFHRFHTSCGADQWQGALSPEEFESILLYVGVKNILSPDEWLLRLRDNRLGHNDLCITFDDGLRCQVEYALPVLEQYGIQAFWFIYTSVFENALIKSEVYSYVAGQTGGMQSLTDELLARCPPEMLVQLDSDDFATYANRMSEIAPFYSPNDLKYRYLRNNPLNKEPVELLIDRIIGDRGFAPAQVARQLWLADEDLRSLTEKGHCVGLHSHDHPYEMARLSRDEQKEQYAKNYAYLFRACGEKLKSMSHPLNSYNDDTLLVLKELGIQCGFRANVTPPSCNGINPSHLEIAREDPANLLLMMRGASP